MTVFLAMDTEVELFQGGRIPLKDFAEKKQDRDILVRLIVKKTAGRFAYAAVRNQSTDFPVIACAASCVGENTGWQSVQDRIGQCSLR